MGVCVLTFGICRFPAPGNDYSRRGQNGENLFRGNVMSWIEQQATEAWSPQDEGARAIAAFDFLTVCIQPVPLPVPPRLETEVESRIQWIQTDEASPSTNGGEGSKGGRKREWHADDPPGSSREAQRQYRRTERQVE